MKWEGICLRYELKAFFQSKVTLVSLYQHPSGNSDIGFIFAGRKSKRLDVPSEVFRACGSGPGRGYKSYGRSVGLYHESVYYRGEKAGFSE